MGCAARFPAGTYPDPFTRYVLIASKLPAKTVRDVAHKIRWETGPGSASADAGASNGLFELESGQQADPALLALLQASPVLPLGAGARRESEGRAV